MILLHGTGMEAAQQIISAVSKKKANGKHKVTWHNSERDRLYFWGEEELEHKWSAGATVSMVLVQRAAESAMYTKAICGSDDKTVCILVFRLLDEKKGSLTPDPDADGLLPSYFLTEMDILNLLKEGVLRLESVMYDDLYKPDLRWEYLAVMRATGRRFPVPDAFKEEMFFDAIRKILFGEGAEVWRKHLFVEPVYRAHWNFS